MTETEQQTAQLIASTYGIPLDWAEGLIPVAFAVGGSPFDLARVIWAESRFNPQAVNPKSGATGLIQFLPSTAQKMGFTIEQIAAMGYHRQLDVTSYYLQLVASGAWAGPPGELDNQYKMALAVFYPAWRNKPPDSVLPESAQAANPGIRTIGDYVDFVLRNAPKPSTAPGMASPTVRRTTAATRKANPPQKGGGGGGLGAILLIGVLAAVGFAATRRATR